jgi:alkaline phosphatase
MVDSDPLKEPTMAEMTAGALKALSQASPSGFVLLVENENTDGGAIRSPVVPVENIGDHLV